MSAAVEVTAIRLPGKESGHVVDCRLDQPSEGSGRPGMTVEIRGWVVTAPARARSLRVVWVGGPHQMGDLLCQVPVDMPRPDLESVFPDHRHAATSGFAVEVGALRLPARFRLELRLVMESGETLNLAELEGTRPSIGVAAAERVHDHLRPAVIVTTGRAGSTWLSHLLNQHPDLVAYRPFKREPRVAAYWLEVVQALSDPASYKQSLQPNFGRGPLWWLGNWPEASRSPIGDDVVADLLGRETPGVLLELARKRIDAFYRSAARNQDKREPRFFVEKSPGLRPRQMELMAEAFPGLRDVVLLRDPRDVLCSILAYKEKNPRAVLLRQDPGLDAEFLDRLTTSYRAALSYTRLAGDRAIVIRYEDLVGDPAAAMRRILAHLGLERDTTMIEEMVDSRVSGMEVHQTAPSVDESVGRWRRDLSPDDQQRVNEIFHEPLSQLGYM